MMRTEEEIRMYMRDTEDELAYWREEYRRAKLTPYQTAMGYVEHASRIVIEPATRLDTLRWVLREE
jgi:hypothetical protein